MSDWDEYHLQLNEVNKPGLSWAKLRQAPGSYQQLALAMAANYDGITICFCCLIMGILIVK